MLQITEAVGLSGNSAACRQISRVVSPNRNSKERKTKMTWVGFLRQISATVMEIGGRETVGAPRCREGSPGLIPQKGT